MRLSRLACAAALVLALPAAALRAELTAEQAREAQAFVARFTAADFADRQAAVEGLVALGSEVLPLVRRARAESKDEEIRLRCAMVERGILERYGVLVEPPAADDPLAPSRVSIEAKDRPLREILAQIGAQSGNAPLSPFGIAAARKVTLSVRGLGYWEALDGLCRPNDLRVARGGGDVAVLTGADTTSISAFAGPVQLKVNWCRKIRTHNFSTREERRDRLEVGLAILWEDRLPVLRVSVDPLKCVADGKEGPVPVWALRADPYQESGAPVRWGSFFDFAGNYGDARSITEISGNVEVEYGIGEHVLKIEDVAGARRKTGGVPGLDVSVTGATRTEEGLEIVLAASAARGVAPVGSRFDSRYGTFLCDAEGNRYECASRVEVHAEKGLLVALVFRAPERKGPWSLAVVYPEKAARRSFPFKLENIPLP